MCTWTQHCRVIGQLSSAWWHQYRIKCDHKIALCGDKQNSVSSFNKEWDDPGANTLFRASNSKPTDLQISLLLSHAVKGLCVVYVYSRFPLKWLFHLGIVCVTTVALLVLGLLTVVFIHTPSQPVSSVPSCNTYLVKKSS